MRIGGAERSVARLINALDHNRFRPIVICLSRSGGAANWIESSKVPIIEINKASTFDRSALKRLTEVLVHYNVDVIHSYNWGTILEATLARRSAGVAAHVHAERGSVLGRAEMHGLRMQLRALCARWAMNRCDTVMTNAKSVAKRVAERCRYPEERIHVIPNGVECSPRSLDGQELNELRTSLGIGPGATVLGSVGRLVPIKGFDTAIHATSHLAKTGGQFHLVLVGDGPLKVHLSALANKLGISDRVHLVGHQQEISRWYSLVDVYVNTSLSEGMSQSLVEALAHQRPLVATNVGDSADVVGPDGQCGRVIEPGDYRQLANAVRWASSESNQLLLRQQADERYRQFFTAEKMAIRYSELYERLADVASRRRR